MSSILIKNGQIVTATDNFKADIFIQDDKIHSIGKNLNLTADTVIDAKNKLVIPGGIDPHVHLEMPFMGTFSSDTYETGTRAALFGGTTTVIDFILQKQGHSLYEAFNEWSGRATGNAVGDYSFHMAVTDFNEQTEKEIQPLIEKEGISSFKMFMAYRGALMIDDRQMNGLMQTVKKHGGIVTAHATNGDMIDFLVAKHRSEGKLSPWYHYMSQPEITESEASHRFTDFGYYNNCPIYIVHMTCEGAANAIRTANYRKQKVFGETCIQYLLLDASLYKKPDFEGAKWVMSPPLREPKDQEQLWAAINQGVVEVVATDHCPFKWQQKLMGKDDFSKIPNGHPAIEHRVELLYSEGVRKGKISLNKMVEVASTNAAKIFGMFPKKGTIAVGSDADIAILNPRTKHQISAATHHMNVDYSAYEGRNLQGKIETVILRGTIAIDQNQCLVPKGYGQFVKRQKVSGVV
ncbi:MAG: dihydropyrimidinase [Chitinophagales bacterium]|nr:dihydropyrimidinase [Bacteroidota bacterium]